MTVEVLFYFCNLVFVLTLIFWNDVSAECLKKKVKVYDLCHTDTYGNVYRSLAANIIHTCAHYCIHDDACQSSVYDESTGLCNLNEGFLPSPSTCALNVKYIQLGEFQCERTGDMKVCGLDIYSTPGTVQGYIQIYANGVWGTVCDDFWESQYYGAVNAAVFCKSFGYSGGQVIYPLGSNSYITDTTPILIDDLSCSGSESHIWNCDRLQSQHNCVHYEDVRVICS